MQVPSDYSEMLSELCAAGAEFMVVGAFAVAHHAQPRFTKEIDIWVNPTPDNAALPHLRKPRVTPGACAQGRFALQRS